MGFIELVEVGYAFPGGRTLFDKVSFKVPDSERVALVGANGVGKTTLLTLIAHADDGHTGLIRVIEVANRIQAGSASRGVAHASSGPCLQQNLVCVMEATA